MFKYTRNAIELLKSRIIITDLDDYVAETWLKNHPSLGESDEVVWEYEKVMDEFKAIYIYN